MRSVLEAPAGRRLKWVLLVAWLAIAVFAGPMVGKLFSITDDAFLSYLPSSAESTEVEETKEDLAFSTGQRAAVVYLREDGLTTQDRQLAERQANELTQRFSNYTDGQPPRIVPSADGKALTYLIVLSSSNDSDVDERVVEDVGLIRDVVQQPDQDLRVYVAGPAGVLADQQESFAGLDMQVLLITLIAVAVLLLLIYRSAFLWLVPLLVVAIAAEVAQVVVYWIASATGATITSASVFILIVLLYGAATDYALLLISRYREELRQHPDVHDAMRAALRRAVPTIAASGGTVAAAMLLLLLADLTSNRALGIAGIVGIGTAVVTVTTLLPVVLLAVGRRVFWPFIPAYGSKPRTSGGVWAKIGAAVDRRPRRIWITTGVVLGIMTIGLTSMNTDLRENDAFVEPLGSTHGQQVLQDHFPPGLTRSTDVIVEQDKAEEALRVANAGAGVLRADIAGQSQGKAVLDIRLDATPDSAEEQGYISALRDDMHAIEGADAKVGGHSAIYLDIAEHNSKDAALIIPLVLLAVLLILVLLLRSIVAPLMLVGTVVLSYGAALGVSALVFSEIFGFPGADSSLPLQAFVFLVALGVDYNIFLMSRVREESWHHGTRMGVLRGLSATGGVITSAGVVLAATFAVLTSLPLVAWVQLGFVVAFGVLLDTLIVRSVLVPALTVDIGERVWWPWRLGRGNGLAGVRGNSAATQADRDVVGMRQK
ncbi:RND superfamily putative drug exporter [Tamaricihabitans halophyticus]|uniref:RND superfamily putative drug exporter n=1 Tax=Tamaricihabitans halophyticus TaxID=1262583 RepID=A0A4R2R240_9PSEU|nr:MMPL family transporter [Tamaricihabitans halophyticus]TCP56782.1 RND superfamily putative drug exporter [Tamaricihabitans halophyticus]